MGSVRAPPFIDTMDYAKLGQVRQGFRVVAANLPPFVRVLGACSRCPRFSIVRELGFCPRIARVTGHERAKP